MYSRNVGGEERTFGVSGRLWHGVLVLFDRQTKSYWTQIDGRAIRGPASGETLAYVPSVFTTWGAWSETHPDTLVLEKTGDALNMKSSNYARYYERPDLFMPHLAEGLGDEVDGKELVFGVRHDGDALAVTETLLAERGVVNTIVGDAPVAVARHSWNGEVLAVIRRIDGVSVTLQTVDDEEPTEVLRAATSGELVRVEDLEHVRVDRAFWYAWARTVEGTRVLFE